MDLLLNLAWFSVCVASISADALHTVAAEVGSTVVLPCKLNVPNQTPHVRWRIGSEVLVEQSNESLIIRPGYDGRVELPADELQKGNCSLVIKNVSVSEETFYKFYTAEQTVSADAWDEISKVKLSIYNVEVITAPLGSTVLLPCEWRNLSIQTPHVEWVTDDETVFERAGEESFPGEGHYGRVDVPEEELINGNCSLVLKNVRASDAGVYRSGMVVKHTEKTFLAQKIKLSVNGSISGDLLFTVTAGVNSTAVLPCKLNNFTSETHIRWRTDSAYLVGQSSQGQVINPEYRDRLMFSENDLRQGNCSLVLRDIRLTDDSFYNPYVVDLVSKDEPGGWEVINRVHLSVDVLQNISASEGSTVLLPCEWRNLSIETPHVVWSTHHGVVFERAGEESFTKKGYEGRVSVSLDQLIKGDCSLVLKNASSADAGVYMSGMVVSDIQEPIVVHKIRLSLSGRSGINYPHVHIIIIISFLVCFLFSH